MNKVPRFLRRKIIWGVLKMSIQPNAPQERLINPLSFLFKDIDLSKGFYIVINENGLEIGEGDLPEEYGGPVSDDPSSEGV